ncbi:hypothetical protein NM688_g3145 [Phlebia brevispora]|uniref:Uncharacterized protein n=1 Tax=Phlebia brevispora TaxID=194682 RepID=A0ACC1T6S7_9APHY|nr:hypothetical protein NM688_g3145 [Phlebia brevispora]
MAPIVLRNNPDPEETEWTFTVAFSIKRQGTGKHLSFSSDQIKFDIIKFPENRILQADDIEKFVLVSFQDLRFPGRPARVAAEYIQRFLSTGLFINGVQYRFYHHSNSQLRSRSCFMRAANADAELDQRIYRLGDFEKIPNAAKRAKRIGLLFSEAKIDWMLDPAVTKDIGDIVRNGEMFSDGCGLMSVKFGKQLSKHKKILFHGRPYTPAVYQIRYRGYKGVLMLHPQLHEEHVHFRKSQKKFTATANNTFSVVDHSLPYAFGRLNNDIVVLLSSLGISNEAFLAKQAAYHELLEAASENWEDAFNLLCAANKYDVAERLLLEGLDSDPIRKAVRGVQNSELSAFIKKDRPRVRTLVPKSRLLFGVCDPYGVLREGEVHVRVMTPRKGLTTLTNVDVLVVRNPCLYPGDCLKLRAVHHPALAHLSECIVFASHGTRAAPSMSSGGDLDGDRFTVIWDPDLVPKKVAESYDYPAPPSRVNNKVTREDLIKHFASYNSMTMGRLASLHQKWVRGSPKGALCDECQELNALYSLVVDGGSVRIPERLEKVPDPPEGTRYVLDVLNEAATAFAQQFNTSNLETLTLLDLSQEDATDMIIRLLSGEKTAISEYELLMKAAAVARRHSINIIPFLTHVDFGALTTSERYAVKWYFDLNEEEHPYIWNSLVRSEILSVDDLRSRKLEGSWNFQRLYSSAIQGRAAFFEYLRDAVQNYHRRVIILKTDDRFSSGIFMKGEIKWNEDSEIDNNILVCSFLPQSSTVTATYRRGVRGYKVFCNDSRFELFNRHRQDTFIFMTRPPKQSDADIITSWALQKLSDHVRRQYGRMNRTPVVTIEIHVVSNRDRVSSQTFDLRFEYVETEEYVRRFEMRPEPYRPNNITTIDWTGHPPELRKVFTGTHEDATSVLSASSPERLLRYMRFSLRYHAEDRTFWCFDTLLDSPAENEQIIAFMDEYPPLAYSALKRFLTQEEALVLVPGREQLAIAIILNPRWSGMAYYISNTDSTTYFGFLWLACLSIRSRELVQEVLLVLSDTRQPALAPGLQTYAHGHGLGIAFDRAEDAADTCPCDDEGRPRRQRVAPVAAKLESIETETVPDPDMLPLPKDIKANIRVDARTTIRVHSHVRLQVASAPQHSTLPPAVLDGIVTRASRGELYLSVHHPLPPEYAAVTWRIYDAGSVATSKAMLDAVQRLAEEGDDCCGFSSLVTGQDELAAEIAEEEVERTFDPSSSLNESQQHAVQCVGLGRMTLIWGPPGTGKTTVVVQILVRLLREDPDTAILMTASTHNAVDNVLERFVHTNNGLHLLRDEEILRAATESTRVNESMQRFTIDARLGGSLTDDPRLIQKAERRVKQARIVFTTCTGAGLGILRKATFSTVLVDEASQLTEPATLIPLVKGCKTAILVGDHVQLRPTVKPMGKALEFDKSLFERLYTGPSYRSMTRTMLEVQYRFPAAIAKFPSEEFYEGRLLTGNPQEENVASLGASSFPWPLIDGKLFPVAFVPCVSEEDHGRQSKSNSGQVELVSHILSLLRSRGGPDGAPEEKERVLARLQAYTIGILTPYARQATLLKQEVQVNQKTLVSTIDGFQGRESDIVIISTVRSNINGDLGFTEDPRRLNVAWTRPKLGLIIVGDERTLKSNAMWQRALSACQSVSIQLPPKEETPHH